MRTIWPGLILVLVALLSVTGCLDNATPSSPPAQEKTKEPPSETPGKGFSPTPDLEQSAVDLWTNPVPVQALESRRMLRYSDLPDRDLFDLAIRFRGLDRAERRTARIVPWGFSIGDDHDFWLLNWDSGQYRQITAKLAEETAHVYIFVEQGVFVDGDLLRLLAETFEDQIYTTSRRVFGAEWSPGVDSDPHLVFLICRQVGGSVAGYQNAADEYPRSIQPFSNEMEIIYLDEGSVFSNSEVDNCLIAHEYHHMVHWAADPEEAVWIVEGLSELACQVNGYDSGNLRLALPAFAETPDTQLNHWSTDLSQAAAHYGASSLFAAYLFDRFGPQAISDLVAADESGLEGLDRLLGSLGSGLTLEDLFADWVVANYINDSTLAQGEYGYRQLALPQLATVSQIRAGDPPVQRRETVAQFAADYLLLQGPGTFQVDFYGSTLVQPVPAPVNDGICAFWGGRGTSRDATLDFTLDLSGQERATLRFDTWYDIEPGADFAYVAVSVDGDTWQTLPGRTTTTDNPRGANLGHGFTGKSDGWIKEEMDLTPYTGQSIQLRFEYITDDGPLRHGILVDNIEVPQLDLIVDAELAAPGADASWEGRGFTRLANLLPQEWLLQLVKREGSGVSVERMRLGPDNTGNWAVDLAEGETGILIISGVTRDTIEPAVYDLSIRSINTGN